MKKIGFCILLFIWSGIANSNPAVIWSGDLGNTLYFTGNPSQQYQTLTGTCVESPVWGNCASTPVSGGNWATATCTISGVGNVNFNTEYIIDGRGYIVHWYMDLLGTWSPTNFSSHTDTTYHRLYIDTIYRGRSTGIHTPMQCTIMARNYDGTISSNSMTWVLVSADVMTVYMSKPAPITSSKYETVGFVTTLTSTYTVGNEVMSYTMSGPCSSWDPHLELPDSSIHRPSDGAFALPASGSNLIMKFTPGTAGPYSCVANFTIYGP
ncbi:TPA: hypothetical protein ACOVI5_002064 [Klebsiella oxytoca]